MEIAFPDRLQHHDHCSLYDAIAQCRYSQWTQLAVLLRDEHPPNWVGSIAAVEQLPSQTLDLVCEIRF